MERRQSTAAAELGFGRCLLFSVILRELGRGESPGRERGERRGRPYLREARHREGKRVEGSIRPWRATARPGSLQEVGDDPVHFAPSPLAILFSFYSSPFLISFSVFDLNTAVKELFGVANELQIL